MVPRKKVKMDMADEMMAEPNSQTVREVKADEPLDMSKAVPHVNRPGENGVYAPSAQPICGRCTTHNKVVLMRQITTKGPLAYYRCDTCQESVKVPRKWRQNPMANNPSVAARPEMDQ